MYTVKQIRQLEQKAINDLGKTGPILMGKAAIASFLYLRQLWPNASRIVVFCGGGNNGGDGYIIAHLAHICGLNVQVRYIGDVNELKNEAAWAYNFAKRSGTPILPFDKNEQLSCDLFVDAILGIGITGTVRPIAKEAIEFINKHNMPVLAIDIPSGLNADTGQICGSAINAYATITFIKMKKGLTINDGPKLCGKCKCDELISWS